MRLLTWNCCRGAFAAKAPLAQALGPDIAVLQECARRTATSSTCLWFGDYQNQGICVLAGPGYTLEAVLPIPDLPRYVIPVRVHGPESFLLFAVWTQKEPTYVEPVLRAAEAYADLIRSEPTVFMGDFNSNAIWDKQRRPARDHSAMVDALSELGLVSSYHHFFGEVHGRETRPTHYFRWHEHEPFHLDYCFIPKTWAERLVNVEVGNYEAWKQWSDHRPVTASVLLWWVAQNLWNISVYMADARAQRLPLVGGGEHDWAYLLGRMGLLQYDQTLANAVQLAGALLFFWAMLRAFQYSTASEGGSAPALVHPRTPAHQSCTLHLGPRPRWVSIDTQSQSGPVA